MSKSTILYVFRSSAWDGRGAADGLDVLMASCAMELNVSALFVHEGVFIIKCGQEQSSPSGSQADASANSAITTKLLSKPFAALDDIGCEHVYVCDKSLNARGLCAAGLTVEHELVSRDQIAMLIDQHDQVLVF